MKAFLHTFGCKANQYDTERMRQELEARGGAVAGTWKEADVCVLNTCTVTNQADADARKMIRRIARERPKARIVVAGCSAVLRADEYRTMRGVISVVEGHDASEVAIAALGAPDVSPVSRGPLVQIGLRAPLDRIDTEPVGGELLAQRRGATRGWLKIQDGCDRKCSFCATRLARGASRSRSPDEVLAEALLLGRAHPEIVLTGIHIGHWGRDLPDGPHGPWTLSRLVDLILERVPDVRIRLGSVEGTEVDDDLIDLLERSGGRLAPHLHMPLQSGSDPVLRRMRRWHTREAYRRRALEIASRVTTLGLGADIITGFPGETDRDHAATVALVDELPFTYLHVFPFSPRDDTVAAGLNEMDPVPQRVAGERSRELRERVQAAARAYRSRRSGENAEVTIEHQGRQALTGDYLRVAARGAEAADPRRLHIGVLRGEGDQLYIDVTQGTDPI